MHWWQWVIAIVGFVSSIHGTWNVKVTISRKRKAAEYDPSNDSDWRDENGIPW